MRGLAALARRSLEDPQLPLTSEALVEWLGGAKSDAGVSVTENRVFGLSAWFRGVALISSVLAAMPIKVYRNGTRERITLSTVLDSPNPAQTPFEFWQTMYCNAIGWGTGYGRKLRDRAGIVRQVWPIHPSRVRFEAVAPSASNPEGRLFHVSDAVTGAQKTYTARDIFVLPYLSPQGTIGLSPLQLARQMLGINIAAEDTSAKFYGSGNRLSGILSSKSKLDETKADALKTRWKKKVSGPDNAGDIAVLDSDTTFQPLAIPPQDAQLLQSREFGVVEVARFLGLPPWAVSAVEKTTSWGTGIEQQKIGLVQFTFQGWVTLSDQRVTRELLPGGWTSGSWYAEHVLEGLLRGDSKTRAQFYAQMIQWGVMNRNEVRALENLEAADGLDEFLTPSNMTLINVDGKFVPLGGDSNSDVEEEGGDDDDGDEA